MRLLVITQDFPPRIGGVQTYSFEIARGLAGMCEHLEVVAPASGGSEAVDERLPFRVHRLPVFSSLMFAPALMAVPRIARAGRFDAALATQWMTAAPGLAARRLGLLGRVFVAAHGRELLVNHLKRVPLAGRGFDAARRSVLARADGFFPVSRYTAGLLEDLGVERSRLHVVHNGTDPDRMAGGDGAGWRRRHGIGDRPLMLTLARIVPHKGIDTVIRAMPEILSSVPEARYAIVGEGPDRDRLGRLTRECGVDGNVVFAGRVEGGDIASCMAACDLFVMPSRLEPPHVEGFGLVFLEAAAAGKPAVGTRSGGIPDAVLDGETGLLVEPGDVHALAEACARLLADGDRAREMGRRGLRRVIEEGTWKHAAQRMYDAIRSSL